MKTSGKLELFEMPFREQLKSLMAIFLEDCVRAREFLIGIK